MGSAVLKAKPLQRLRQRTCGIVNLEDTPPLTGRTAFGCVEDRRMVGPDVTRLGKACQYLFCSSHFGGTICRNQPEAVRSGHHQERSIT